jgi:hypothetical protein
MSFEEFTGFDDDDIDIDFSNVENINNKNEVVFEPKYDYVTSETYRVLRLRKMDPILFYEFNGEDEQYAFKFKYMWDSYTGERLKNANGEYIEDKHGPLYFDPDVLIKHFWTGRLNKLWINPSDESGGYYGGTYDDGVGAGEEFNVTGRGSHPEWYLFRLPIHDCYLTTDHNKQYITFGPKLNDDEIKEIEKLAELRKDNYKELYGHHRPSLSLMKKLYDNSISKKPNIHIPKKSKLTKDELKEYYNRENRSCVDKLVNMRG